MKRIRGIIIFVSGLFLAFTSTAQANVPSHCAVDSKKLGELARAARHLPSGFDQDIFGKWQHATKIMGHDVNIRVGKYNSGKFKIRLKVSGWAENFEEENPMMICTTNRREFRIYAYLNGKNQDVPVEVKSPTQIEILNGRLSGLYLKRR